ncbi:hypothetical protein BDZ85DRAFT_265329 [Elsinoe ampelina]|uniref:Uncharacterized protein n=1 Tax=Elsinoe ampelina TaxID=302913 RepID=A0A6A6G6U3_9PEZI|nr:hypothetical protein BDZ85DRAFT_265329 [Elsinoe ampelina]
MRSIAANRIKLWRHVSIAVRASTGPAAGRDYHIFKRGFAKVEVGKQNLFDVHGRHDTILSTNKSEAKGDRPPPDERTLKLGKTIRTLHERLPTLLASPLPQELLSPNISLHLFPSTHPHLPTVTGRIPYTGALWTAPVAWGRLPVVGNVKLIILSERMVRNGGTAVSHDCRDEKLIVKWKTCGKSKENGGKIYRGISASEQVDRLTRMLKGEGTDEEFCGMFIFEFDEEGRIQKHTIEHAENGGDCDRMNKVVSVTDWLLGKAPWRRKDEMIPGLAFCEVHRDRREHLQNHGNGRGR